MSGCWAILQPFCLSRAMSLRTMSTAKGKEKREMAKPQLSFSFLPDAWISSSQYDSHTIITQQKQPNKRIQSPWIHLPNDPPQPKSPFLPHKDQVVCSQNLLTLPSFTFLAVGLLPCWTHPCRRVQKPPKIYITTLLHVYLTLNNEKRLNPIPVTPGLHLNLPVKEVMKKACSHLVYPHCSYHRSVRLMTLWTSVCILLMPDIQEAEGSFNNCFPFIGAFSKPHCETRIWYSLP